MVPHPLSNHHLAEEVPSNVEKGFPQDLDIVMNVGEMLCHTLTTLPSCSLSQLAILRVLTHLFKMAALEPT